MKSKVLAASFFAISALSAPHVSAAAAVNPADASDLAVRFDVTKQVLGNGLTVLYHVDRTVPLVNHQLWFRVGGKNDGEGTKGIAHLFEHMMFRGAKRYSGVQFDKVLEANGATNNAFTTNDRTAYWIQAPSDKLELIMDIESDRMVNLKIDDAALSAEREVVKEESRMRRDDVPMRLLYEALMASVFKQHPYRFSVLGTMDDLNHVTAEVGQKFHRVWYAPNNAVLVISGDFDLKKAEALVQKYYGPLQRQEISNPDRPVEPIQKQARTAILTKAVSSPLLGMAYPAPKAGSPESRSLDVLSLILGGGSSSRLHRRLVYKEQVATTVVVSNNSMEDAGVIVIYSAMRDGADVEHAQKTILSELWKVRNKLVSPDELERARVQIQRQHVFGLKSLASRGEELGLHESLFGDYRRLFDDVLKYASVSAEDLQKAATKYLQPFQGSVITVRGPGKKTAARRTE